MHALPSPCPRCGSPTSTRTMSAALCPACLIITALAQDDEPCPYRVLAPIDEDARGVTYLAQAMHGPHRHVALKIHERENNVDAVLDRYARWQEPLANFQHPSLARLVDVGLTTEGLLYVATEFVAGQSLVGWNSAECSHEVRITLVEQLTDALTSAHSVGLAHMSLDARKVKLATAHGPRATILGVGTALIFNDLEPRPDADLTMLQSISRLILAGT